MTSKPLCSLKENKAFCRQVCDFQHFLDVLTLRRIDVINAFSALKVPGFSLEREALKYLMQNQNSVGTPNLNWYSNCAGPQKLEGP